MVFILTEGVRESGRITTFVKLDARATSSENWV
jgi:hypothetical protein